jgi:lipopolysaccharide export system protein LptA
MVVLVIRSSKTPLSSRATPPLAVVALAGVLALAGDRAPALAAPLGVIEGQSLDVAAERLDVDVEKGTAELRGNVTAHLGELELRCPTVELRYDKSPRVSWARGKGGVTARFRGITATASTVELDTAARSVVLGGGVRLARGRGWVTAEQATIDVTSGRVSLQEVKGSVPVDPQASEKSLLKNP